MDLRVASNFASFSGSGGEAPGRPESSLLPSRLRWGCESPRFPHLPAVPKVNLRVTPNPRSFGCSGWRFSEFPRIPRPPALPPMRLQVAPNPASAAGPMMTPRFSANFASSGCAADESSRPIGSRIFPPDSGCLLNLALSSLTGQAGQVLRNSIELASSCQAGTAFPIPYRVTNWKGVWTG
jgi:hypothetical protein